LEDYILTKNLLCNDFRNKKIWNKKQLVNIAMAGYFSSDRTIEEYNKDIWKLK
jgi:starch phosphorylase